METRCIWEPARRSLASPVQNAPHAASANAHMSSVDCNVALQLVRLSIADFGHAGVWNWLGGAAQHAAIAHLGDDIITRHASGTLYGANAAYSSQLAATQLQRYTLALRRSHGRASCLTRFARRRVTTRYPRQSTITARSGTARAAPPQAAALRRGSHPSRSQASPCTAASWGQTAERRSARLHRA